MASNHAQGELQFPRHRCRCQAPVLMLSSTLTFSSRIKSYKIYIPSAQCSPSCWSNAKQLVACGSYHSVTAAFDERGEQMVISGLATVKQVSSGLHSTLRYAIRSFTS
jgi:hypothetical protein